MAEKKTVGRPRISHRIKRPGRHRKKALARERKTPLIGRANG